MVDARLEDGSRLNAVIPPLSLKGPVVTIRKFRRDMERIDDFLRTGAMTPYMARFLDAAIRAGVDFLVLRYISDIIGEENQEEDYLKFEKEMSL